MDLYNEIQIKIRELQEAISTLALKGQLYAEAYRNYRVLLAKELMQLKANGMPVTIAYDIARGNEEVAGAKFQELTTEAIYKANLENVQAIKLQIKVLQNQYDKEWGSAGGQFDNN